MIVRVKVVLNRTVVTVQAGQAFPSSRQRTNEFIKDKMISFVDSIISILKMNNPIFIFSLDSIIEY